MTVDPRLIKRWPKQIMKKYELAKNSSEFYIKHIDDDVLGDYYILLQPSSGHYKGQSHIIEFKSKHDTKVFPFNPPHMEFKTNIYHPNIMITSGSICVDILTESSKWSPQYDINAVMSSIILLLGEPNNASPYNALAARLYGDCEKKYKSASKNITDPKHRDKLYDECFKPYDLETKKSVMTNLKAYHKYFPHLLNDKIDEMKI
jgi:ubiquitin-protein ligase